MEWISSTPRGYPQGYNTIIGARHGNLGWRTCVMSLYVSENALDLKFIDLNTGK